MSARSLRGRIEPGWKRDPDPLARNPPENIDVQAPAYRRSRPRYLGKEPSALNPEERSVLASIDDESTLSRDVTDMDEAEATFGDRLSDRVAAIGGSWSFIIVFLLVLFGWMLLNTDVLAHWHLAFDPYPYIFLNLMLSLVAAIQAPVIMMSQNRQGDRDRLAASHDYEVNLRAEVEILRLHEKMDALIARLDVAENVGRKD